jgi:hypothetical protein
MTGADFEISIDGKPRTLSLAATIVIRSWRAFLTLTVGGILWSQPFGGKNSRLARLVAKCFEGFVLR